jgi:hypothetical protein
MSRVVQRVEQTLVEAGEPMRIKYIRVGREQFQSLWDEFPASGCHPDAHHREMTVRGVKIVRTDSAEIAVVLG